MKHCVPAILLIAGIMTMGCGVSTETQIPVNSQPKNESTQVTHHAEPAETIRHDQTSKDNNVKETVLAEEDPSSNAPKVTFKKIKFKDGKGENLVSIKPMPDGAKLVDVDELEIARYKLSAGKLKIRDDQDQTVAYVILSAPHFHVEDAAQEKRLWKLQRQDDGDWMLESNNERIYRIKRRDYGFEIEDPGKQSLYKIKRKGEKTSLRDGNDTTVQYSKDKVNPLSMACFGFDAIDDLRIRAGLAIAIEIQEGN